jgi:hypothetical protein
VCFLFQTHDQNIPHPQYQREKETMCLFSSAEMKLQKKYPVMEEFGIFLDLLKLQVFFNVLGKLI